MFLGDADGCLMVLGPHFEYQVYQSFYGWLLLCCPNFITGSYALSFMALCHGHAYSIPYSSSLPSVVQGSMRLFQRVYKIKIVFIIIVRCYFPLSCSFTCDCTMEFSRGYRHVMMPSLWRLIECVLVCCLF